MPKVQYTCTGCGKVGEDYPSQSREFCTLKCMREYRTRMGLSMKPRTGRYEPCVTCSVPVWRAKSAIKNGTYRFCSTVCADASKRKGTVERACGHCGVTMTLPVNATRKFCKRECWILGQIKRPLGRTHNGRPARMTKEGYVMIWTGDRWEAEHRVVAAEMIGRPLTRDEDVHHINRVKSDNRPENLAVVDPKTHANLTARERITDRQLVAEYLKRFGPLEPGALPELRKVEWINYEAA